MSIKVHFEEKENVIPEILSQWANFIRGKEVKLNGLIDEKDEMLSVEGLRELGFNEVYLCPNGKINAIKDNYLYMGLVAIKRASNNPLIINIDCKYDCAKKIKR